MTASIQNPQPVRTTFPSSQITSESPISDSDSPSSSSSASSSASLPPASSAIESSEFEGQSSTVPSIPATGNGLPATDSRTLEPNHAPASIQQSNNAPSTPSTLLDSLCELLPRFVVLPKHAAQTLALWIVHTYAFQLREVSTYIGIESPEKRCGKTTLLSVLGKLVNRPVVASNISPSAFFRVIEEMQPTLLIDEADTFLQGNDELRGIFNAGYHKPNAYVIRVSSEPGPRKEKPAGTTVGGRPSATSSPSGNSNQAQTEIHMGSTWKSSLPSPFEPSTINSQPSTLVRYSCWCPKVIAAIGHLPETLADRCIVLRMQRKRGDEECERLRNLDGAELRQRCSQFAIAHQEAITSARPEIPASLNDRAADIWEPLFVIADIAGGHWPETARQAAVAFTARAEASTPMSALLLDIFIVFAVSGSARMFSRTLVGKLNARSTDRPWAELLKGKPITELWLSQRLRRYGIRPRNICIGEQQAKGYLEDEFAETFRRYIPKSEAEAFLAELVAPAEQDAQTANGY